MKLPATFVATVLEYKRRNLSLDVEAITAYNSKKNIMAHATTTTAIVKRYPKMEDNDRYRMAYIMDTYKDLLKDLRYTGDTIEEYVNLALDNNIIFNKGDTLVVKFPVDCTELGLFKSIAGNKAKFKSRMLGTVLERFIECFKFTSITIVTYSDDEPFELNNVALIKDYLSDLRCLLLTTDNYTLFFTRKSVELLNGGDMQSIINDVFYVNQESIFVDSWEEAKAVFRAAASTLIPVALPVRVYREHVNAVEAYTIYDLDKIKIEDGDCVEFEGYWGDQTMSVILRDDTCDIIGNKLEDIHTVTEKIRDILKITEVK